MIKYCAAVANTSPNIDFDAIFLMIWSGILAFWKRIKSNLFLFYSKFENHKNESIINFITSLILCNNNSDQFSLLLLWIYSLTTTATRIGIGRLLSLIRWRKSDNLTFILCFPKRTFKWVCIQIFSSMLTFSNAHQDHR